MNEPSHIIAICYIAKTDDAQNKCVLTQDHLYVTRKGKQNAFELDQITQVLIKQKKLLFPLVLGGVVGSLFLIAGFNFLVNIWIAMIIGLAGMLLFYYGWVGSRTLTIYTKVKEYDIFIDQETSPLQAFMSMVNDHFILGKNKTIKYYLPLAKDKWQQAEELGYIESPDTGLRLYSEQLRSNDRITIVIDPAQIPNPINYRMDEGSQEVVPYIYGNIDLTMVQ